ncbi:MAG: ribonuclease P protein component [Flavobacteriales bacterium]
MDFSLPKKYKLCSLKKIEELYAKGNLVKAFPLRLLYLEVPDTNLTEPNQPIEETVSFQVLFSAPKRKFKRAHDRNYIKRLLREILRHHKHDLENALLQQQKKLIFSITFVGTERPDYKFLEQKLQTALQQLLQQIQS